MKLNEIIFLKNLPTIDLHGYDREMARVATNDFIKDNIKMKNEIIVIVHGKGRGIVKETVHKTLNKNKKVIAFKTDYFNDGCTIIQINTNEE